MKLDYKKMIKEVDGIVESDFVFDVSCRKYQKDNKYTQKEAQEMAILLGRIYLISHCTSCKACQTKYLTNSPK